LLAVGETKAVLNAKNLAKAFHIRAEIDPLKKIISKIEKQ
jgi:fepc protein